MRYGVKLYKPNVSWRPDDWCWLSVSEGYTSLESTSKTNELITFPTKEQAHESARDLPMREWGPMAFEGYSVVPLEPNFVAEQHGWKEAG